MAISPAMAASSCTQVMTPQTSVSALASSQTSVQGRGFAEPTFAFGSKSMFDSTAGARELFRAAEAPRSSNGATAKKLVSRSEYTEVATRSTSVATAKKLVSRSEYKEVIANFFKSVAYETDRPAPARNVVLENHVRAILESEKFEEPHRSETMSHVTWASALADLFYPDNPLEVNVVVATFSVLFFHIDDGTSRNLFPELPDLPAKLVNGEAFQCPVLRLMARILGEDMPRHFGPYGTHAILISFLNLVYATLIESAYPNGFQVVPSSARFSRLLRVKSGISEAYIHFMFPAAKFPEHLYFEKYIQIVPDFVDVIDLANDLLSFYKEAVVGTEGNIYILNAARAQGCAPLKILRDVSHQVSSGFENAHASLQITDTSLATVASLQITNTSLAAVAAKFMDGYLTFHVCQDRYRLSECGVTFTSVGKENVV